MRRSVLLWILAASPVLAQYTPISGWCQQGNQQVVTVGSPNSTTLVQRSYPSCTVTVAIYGGGSATIYSDSMGTSLGNPFTANSAGSWTFFVAAGTYSVTLSGAGIAAPFIQNFAAASAGAGITSLNTLTSAIQSFATGTTGTDFGIASSGSTHVFNLPSASSTNRGALTSSDWIAFNAKQSALSFTAPLVNTSGTISLNVPLTVTQGGTNGTSATAAFNNLSPLANRGDILRYTGSTNSPLPIGTVGQCLVSNGTDPQWLPCSGSNPISAATTNCIVTANSATSIFTNTNCPSTDSSGNITFVGNATFPLNISHATETTATNCTSSASPAVCGSAAAGSVVIATSATTVVVNTTAVTANSQIFVQSDKSLGTKLGVTCNTEATIGNFLPIVSARVAATSFTIAITGSVATNPECLSFFVVN